MADIIHDVHHEDGTSSALVSIVAMLAILLILGIALYAFRLYPFDQQSESDTTPSVNINLDGTLPQAVPANGVRKHRRPLFSSSFPFSPMHRGRTRILRRQNITSPEVSSELFDDRVKGTEKVPLAGGASSLGEKVATNHGQSS